MAHDSQVKLRIAGRSEVKVAVKMPFHERRGQWHMASDPSAQAVHIVALQMLDRSDLQRYVGLELVLRAAEACGQ